MAQDALAPARCRAPRRARRARPAVLIERTRYAASRRIAARPHRRDGRRRRDAQDRARIARSRGAADRRARHRRLVARQAQGGAPAVLPERTALPGDDEIEAALRRTPRALRRRRARGDAARAARGGADAGMRELARLRPDAGRAASPQAGRPSTATSASSSSPTTSKAVELALINRASRIAAAQQPAESSTTRARRPSFVIDTPARRRAARRPRSRDTGERRAAGRDGHARAARSARAGDARPAASRDGAAGGASRARASPRRVEREVGEDRVGAGALDRRSAPPARTRARRASRSAPRPSASRIRRYTW